MVQVAAGISPYAQCTGRRASRRGCVSRVALLAVRPCDRTKADAHVRFLSKAALDLLQKHEYPGNIRELEDILCRAVASAMAANSEKITSSDIQFRASTLPQLDKIVAFLVRDGSEGREVLLRRSPHWRNFEFPGARVEDSDGTYEKCIARTLEEKLGLKPGEYVADHVHGSTAVEMIDYSGRDKQLKQYHCYAYNVSVEVDSADLGTADNFLWAPFDSLRSEGWRSANNVSPMVAPLLPLLIVN